MQFLTTSIYRSYIWAICLLWSGLLCGQTYDGDLVLNTQDAIDNFSYTAVTGSLTVSDGFDNPTVTNLNGLNGLSSVGGDLSLFNLPVLDNLTGLSQLTQVGGSLYFSQLLQVSSLNGLHNLSSVGGDLTFFNLPILDNLAGLSQLTQVSGSLYFSQLLQVSSLNGLHNLSSVGGDLSLFNLPVLDNLTGLSQLTQVGGSLYFSQLLQVSSLNGLHNLSSVGGDFGLDVLPTLSSLAPLSNLTTLGGGLSLSQLGISEITIWSSLTSLSGSLSLRFLDQLTDISGLANISSIGGQLELAGLSQLANLNTFSNLTQLGGSLNLSRLPLVTQLDAFSNLHAIGSWLYVFNLPQLTQLNGLSNVTQINGFLALNTLTALTDLDGLSSLSSINGGLGISNLPLITHLNGLQGLSSGVQNININNNPMLSACCAVFPFIEFSSYAIFENNASGCNSVVQVSDDCNNLPFNLVQTNGGCTSAATYNENTQVLSLSGTDCYYSSPFQVDEMGIVETSLCGDGEIVVRVNNLSNNAWAGVIMRETGEAGSKKVALTISNQTKARREKRQQTDASATLRQIPSGNRKWLRLVRTGNTFIGYLSNNRLQWSQAMYETIPMNSCMRVGLLLTNRQASPASASVDFGQLYIGAVTNSNLSQTSWSQTQLNAPADLQVYPNPVHDLLTLDLGDHTDQVLQAALYNSTGQTVRQLDLRGQAQQQYEWSLADLAAGVYWLRVSGPAEGPITRRIIVQHP